MFWSDTQIVRLLRLVAQGYSARQIGLIMHVSRNAVIGRVNRVSADLLKALPARSLRLNPDQPRQPRGYRGPKPQAGSTMVKRRPEAEVKPGYAVARVETRKQAPLLLPLTAKVVTSPKANNCTIMGLSDAVCRWPMWAIDMPAEPLYCGAPTHGAPPWCPVHAKVAQVSLAQDGSRLRPLRQQRPHQK